MPTTTSSTLSDLYELDQVAWLDAMVALIRRGSVADLDFAHLAEYLADVANRQRRQVEEQLSALLVHVLKWVHLPEHRSRRWNETILQQCQELRHLVGCHALRSHADTALPAAYANAIERTLAETCLPAETFSDKSPYTFDELLRFDVASEWNERPSVAAIARSD